MVEIQKTEKQTFRTEAQSRIIEREFKSQCAINYWRAKRQIWPPFFPFSALTGTEPLNMPPKTHDFIYAGSAPNNSDRG